MPSEESHKLLSLRFAISLQYPQFLSYSHLTPKYPKASGLFAAILRRAKPYIALAMREFSSLIFGQSSI